MTIHIVTDSTSDISPSVAAEFGITVVPCYLNIAGQSYRDGVDMSRQEFYARLPEVRTFPQTSSPPVPAFTQAYEQAAATGASEIISLHVAGAFSSVIDAARLAAQSIRTAKVTVVDSGTVSLGMGFMAITAARAAAAGKSVTEISGLLLEKARRTVIFAALDTVEYLRKGGRASRLQVSLATFLHIFPVLRVFQSEVSMERIRTRARAVQRLVEKARALAPLEELAVLHTNARQKAESVCQAVENLVPPGVRIWIEEVTPAIGSHVGPNGVGLVCVRARQP